MAANTFDGSGEGGPEGRRIWQIVSWWLFPEQYGGVVRLKLGYSGEAITSKEVETLSRDDSLKKRNWKEESYF